MVKFQPQQQTQHHMKNRKQIVSTARAVVNSYGPFFKEVGVWLSESGVKPGKLSYKKWAELFDELWEVLRPEFYKPCPETETTVALAEGSKDTISDGQLEALIKRAFRANGVTTEKVVAMAGNANAAKSPEVKEGCAEVMALLEVLVATHPAFKKAGITKVQQIRKVIG